MPRPITSLIFGLGAIVAPSVGFAQPSLALHASRASTQDAPWLYGATVAVASHGFGLRLGGAAGLAPLSIIDVDRDVLWTADADVVLAPTLWGGGSSVNAVVPYLFVGAGMQPRAGSEAVEDALPHWSWGGGLTIPLVSRLGLVAEARSRTLFDPQAIGAIAADRRSTELRAGLAFRFGGASTGRAPPRPSGRKPSIGTIPVPAIPGIAIGTRVLPTARRYLGVKYRYGGTSPTAGFDCSGFVQYVFARHDVQLPRTSRQQAGAGARVEPRVAKLTTGDLMFFAENGSRVSHVAIYAGENRIIHSTSSGGEVRYDDLSSSRGRWFATRLVGARRITSAGVGLADLVRALESGTLDVKGLALDPPDRAPPPR